MLPSLNIEQDQLSTKLEKLAEFSDSPSPAVTRVLFTPTERAARAFIRQEMREAGLEMREDGVGNIFGLLPGQQPDLPPVATGSHLDAVPHGGRFDGTVGLLGGIEALRALKNAGYVPVRSIEAIMFSAEAPTRFGISCIGSRLLTGSLNPSDVASLRDDQGNSFDEIRREAGYTTPLTTVAVDPQSYSAFIELHIEQAPYLEQANVPIGIVTSIAAPATLKITVVGQGGHAGGLLMTNRQDALTAASEIVLAIERAPATTGRREAVATVGQLTVHPGGVNSIPSRVDLTADVRDIAQAPRDSMVAFIQAAVDHIAKRRQVVAEVLILNADPPCTAGENILAAIRQACSDLRTSSIELISRAYHDSLFMSRICPVGMIFIPSKGGVSHRPEEYSSPQQIQRGVEVLANTLAILADQ